MKIPNAVKYLLIANIVFYVATMLMQVRGIDLAESLGLFYVGSPRFMPHQIVTYMFMHSGIWHIFLNMFALWMFGRIMEQVWGFKKFLIYYFVCGIGAAVTQEIGQALGLFAQNACTVGASGAVFGILLAFGVTFPDEKIYIIPIPFPIKAKYFVGLYALLEVVEFLSVNDNVAHLAHLGGMLFGLLLIVYWNKHKDKDINNWKRTSFGRQPGESGNVFGWGTGARTRQKRPEFTTYRNASAEQRNDMQYNARKKADEEAIDKILDKIRKTGWDSLSEEEKRLLFEASRKK